MATNLTKTNIFHSAYIFFNSNTNSKKTTKLTERNRLSWNNNESKSDCIFECVDFISVFRQRATPIVNVFIVFYWTLFIFGFMCIACTAQTPHFVFRNVHWWKNVAVEKTQFVSSRRLKHKFKRVAHTHPCSTLNVHNCVWATDRWLCICVLFISKRTKRLTMQRNAKQIALWVWHKQLKNTHKYTRTLCHYLNRFFFSVFWKETTEVFWHEIRISATEVWSEIRNMNASTCSK